MQRVVLPIEEKPAIRCYHNMAFPLSIIQGCSKYFGKDCTPWLIGKYQNCVYYTNSPGNDYGICIDDWWGWEEGVLIHQCIELLPELIKSLNAPPLDIVKHMIKNGCYVSGGLNEKYIPGKSAFGRYDYHHDYLVYGYDDDENVLYSIGYLSQRKYVPFKIKYVDFSCAIDDNLQPKKSFEIWKYNSEYEFNINIPRIRTCFTDYYNSTTSYGKREKALYGFEANDHLKEYIRKFTSINNRKEIDDRYTRAFMEHKKMVLLCAKSLQSILEFSVDPLKSVYEKSCSIFYLSIKYNIGKDINEITRICNLFDEIVQIEQKTIKNIIDALSYYVNS
ncbi:MAG: hypothetical protein IJT36_01365 [Alphaproteobacteria bacterium]|nr:hypothetical protein [Alphaproteobacteria bacterium]